MKYCLLIAFTFVAFIAKAQITLVHTYDSAGYYGVPKCWQQLYIVKLEVDGDKFVFADKADKLLRFYNLNHTLWKTISFANATDMDSIYNNQWINYISQHLFDLDDEIEFLYIDNGGNPIVEVTQVVNEDGSILFTANNQGARLNASAPQTQLPIYNTSAGTFMILSGGASTDGNAYVYSLPGTLSNAIQEGNAQLMQAQGGALSNLYPNPSNGAVTLQYALPKGEKQGEIILYNTHGAEVKRYKVDDTFSDIILDNKQLPAGTYFYQLTTSKGAVGSKKMVVVK
ncbi:MAG: T9SS type A sorting domain-containing protein [Bacteroidetes bacterium]|nr:T9SS type A sorting domain-containing protein [Bacteroidota bacterium]